MEDMQQAEQEIYSLIKNTGYDKHNGKQIKARARKVDELMRPFLEEAGFGDYVFYADTHSSDTGGDYFVFARKDKQGDEGEGGRFNPRALGMYGQDYYYWDIYSEDSEGKLGYLAFVLDMLTKGKKAMTKLADKLSDEFTLDMTSPAGNKIKRIVRFRYPSSLKEDLAAGKVIMEYKRGDEWRNFLKGPMEPNAVKHLPAAQQKWFKETIAMKTKLTHIAGKLLDKGETKLAKEVLDLEEELYKQEAEPEMLIFSSLDPNPEGVRKAKEFIAKTPKGFKTYHLW